MSATRFIFSILLASLLGGPAAFAVDPRPTFPQGVQGVATSPWYFNLRNAAGTEIGTAANPVRVDTTNTTAQTVTQGNAGTAAQGWFVKWTDGTSTAAVKAASTAPLATDTAGVVTLSPNGNQATAANQTTEITALQIIDNIAHANDVALNNGVPIMGQLDDTSTGTVTENNVSTIRITASRAEHVNLRNASGTEIGTTTTPIVAAGNVAAAATDSGNPLKVGGVYNATPPAYTTGQRGDFQIDQAGRLHVRQTIRSGAVYGNIAVGLTGVEVKVGGSRLAGRRYVAFLPFDNDMFFCFDTTCSNCTTSNGMPAFKSQFFEVDADDTASVCLVSANAAKNARIQEAP